MTAIFHKHDACSEFFNKRSLFLMYNAVVNVHGDRITKIIKAHRTIARHPQRCREACLCFVA